MLKVCQYTGNSSMSILSEGAMKHPSSNYEVFEFNLGQAKHLRCINTEKATTCGECEACTLNNKLKDAKEWFPRLGDHSKKKLMLGLLRRFHSVDLLQQISSVLSPLLNKDFTYSRCRTNPGLDQDSATLSSDRALPSKSVEELTISTWKWFEKSNYWSKANFAMSLLQLCESHLLHALGTQARTLLISEEKAFSTIADDDYVEAGSIASTDYSFRTEEHPELELLIRATPDYGHPTINPLTGEPHFLTDEIDNADSGDEMDIASSANSIDPAVLVISTSAKAHSGVSRHVDFIRRLPIQITKFILNLLDEASLNNALCVNKIWRNIVEEVINDELINQKLNEDFMLMQGASAQGAHPKYAKDIDVLVPNMHPGSREVVRSADRVLRASYRSEYNFETAYSGVSTRKVIMEERNVYCGAYNVMVLIDQEDPHRVVHTIGQKLIAIGSKDRKVRFIESESGKELKEPVITGHAGSVRCVYLCEDREFVLSGSYDTSIRMWNIKTGKCLKIFRGHRDTVLTIDVLGDYMISGAKDSSCKIWDLQTGKCHRTFRHRKPIHAVAMDKEMCITGCEGGKVKVWDIKTGNLLKSFKNHTDQVTAIKFDRWHIITGSKDSYAFVYSAVGNHSRCLNALRHPKAVLCLEFMYLRVVTGSADGRLRIWNMVNGQCCRIMRGNSRSDPILSILAIDDRITLNTQVNLLVLNFEPVEWDYTLQDDKLPSLVKYESYSAAPIRQQPYSYIRAQRMKKAGASNMKILGSKQEDVIEKSLPQTSYRAPQLPHSAKSLSSRNLLSAKMIQTSTPGVESGYESSAFPSPSAGHESRMTFKSIGSEKMTFSSSQIKSPISTPLKPPLPKSRPATTKSGVSQASVAIIEPPHVQLNHEEIDDEDDDIMQQQDSFLKRRVSWAFDKPLIPKTKEMSLSETKAILRSQMRMKTESIVPPNFIYLTVNAIQNSMKSNITTANTQQNMRDISTRLLGQKKKTVVFPK